MDPELILRPIGTLRCGKQVKFAARHQPAESEPEENVIELLPDPRMRTAVQDLAGFTRIWLVWWFHKNPSWRPLVLPPRGPAQRRGVFATRSPHRPNPIGITPVRLLGVTAGQIRVGACDLVDGTPILDLKPYIPAYDSFPDEQAGWMDAMETQEAEPAPFLVQFTPLATSQAEWLQSQWGIDFRPRLHELLSRDPMPHRTRRIRRRPDGLGEIACGAWRGAFQVTDQVVEVQFLESGFPVRFLADLRRKEVPDREAQLAFRAHWGQA